MKTTFRNIMILLGLGTLTIGCTAFLYGWDPLDGAASQDRAAVLPRTGSTVRATGRLEPEEVVDVGAQLCGRIVALGMDASGRPIGTGSRVEEGTILARIDGRLAATEVAQGEAALAQARSAVGRAKADLEQYKAKLPEAEARWTGTQQLQKSGAANAMELVMYKSGYDVAKASIAVGEASVVQAQDAVAQAEATLQQARQKLSYAVVRSPVAGVVLERRVSVGQTIICNMQAPSLFLIAKDLQHMRLSAPVGEAEIGHIHPGQAVQFSVAARPGETFDGTVSQVRLDGKPTDHGTVYTAEIAVDNSEGRLLPYLTASVQFLVDRQP